MPPDGDEDDDVLSGFAVIELHPDDKALSYVDTDDKTTPELPVLRIVCGQFSVKISPARGEISSADIQFADAVADAAVAYRERVQRIADTGSESEMVEAGV